MKSNIRISSNRTPVSQNEAASSKRNIVSAYALSIVGILLVLNLCIHFDATHSDVLLKGTSVTSFAQKLMLLTSGFLFLNLRRWRKDLKNALVFVSAFFMVIFLYKSNHWIEAYFHIPWYIPALKFIAAAVIVAFRGGFGLIRELGSVFQSYNAKLILYSGLGLILLVGLFNCTGFWHYALGTHYSENLMHTISNSTQLAVFIFIAIESVKTRIVLQKQQNA